ncbi:MAG: AbrB/MazE/SpoVT family DNA-binding domain-containing protein [Promethearchaeota archaeon]
MSHIIKTKISSGYQTVIPAPIRKKFQGGPGDEVIWSIIGDEVFIRIRRKTNSDPLAELIGKFSTEENDDATSFHDLVVNEP